MKKCWLLIFLPAFLLSLCACSQDTNGQISNTEQMTWQEQYDLGVRYLSEGNYEEAIIAFTAAIEINPKQALAYVGRGDAYVGLGETEENLAAAQADYETAIGLDETTVAAYLGLAEIYIKRGEHEKAREILKRALEKLGDNSEIQNRLLEIRNHNAYGGVEFTERHGYKDEVDLTNQEISWLETALNAAATFDEPALRQLLNQCLTDTQNNNFILRTIWKGYKVELSLTLPPPDLSRSSPMLVGEFRSEDSTGYSFMVHIPGEVTGVTGSSYGYLNRLSSCQCLDWQWNGIATIMDVDIRMDSDKIDISLISNGTVQMVNNLRTGDYVQDYKSFTKITTYQNGITIAHDGETQEPDNVFWGIIFGHNGPLEGQAILDSLYW